jgi:hypothetical protein
MKYAAVWFVVVSSVLPLSVPAADATPKERSAESATSPLLEALKMREQLAVAVMGGGEDFESALERLRDHPAPTGLGLGRETEYALAVVEIGQRLIAADRPKEAEAFFREGEEALGAALGNLRADDRHERIMVLRNRAMVRSRYLGKGAEAKADFAEAIALRPEDKAIVRQRDLLLSGYGDLNRASAPTHD